VRAILESECLICSIYSISSSLNNQLVLQWDTEARFDIDFVVQNEDLSMGARLAGVARIGLFRHITFMQQLWER